MRRTVSMPLGVLSTVVVKKQEFTGSSIYSMVTSSNQLADVKVSIFNLQQWKNYYSLATHCIRIIYFFNIYTFSTILQSYS